MNEEEIVLTPMMKQFLDLKAKHPDAVMLFRCGDFYETYSTDAIVAAEILGITLTKRANGKGKTIEMAGFPHHALDTYLPKLVRAGKRVAIMAYEAHRETSGLQAWRQLNNDPVSYAHDLYADLRELDHVDADIILVEALPLSSEWQGVSDRLRRAAFDSQGVLQAMLVG